MREVLAKPAAAPTPTAAGPVAKPATAPAPKPVPPATGRLIDGKAIAQHYRDGLAQRVAQLRARNFVPHLTVILVGENAASRVYVRNKAKAAEGIGVSSDIHSLPASTSQTDLLLLVEELNRREEVHGILVQLPLPSHIDARAVIEAIDPNKDVDGFHYQNVGALSVGAPAFYPCTPLGVMKLLEHERIPIEGQHAVIVGRSNIVGKPMAMLLINAGATVTVCHSRTRDLASLTRQADILIAAVGKPGVIHGDMLKPGATVIDVGINRLPDGTLCGDLDFASCARIASSLTPVPGGVGPMTIAMLLANTVQAAEARLR